MATQTFHRGIRDMKIALWTAENSYGTDYDILGARNMSVTWVVESDELRGDDVVLDRYTKLVSVTVTIEMASVDLEVADMLLGGTLVSNGDYEDFMVAESDEVPYVALAGRVVGSGGTADLHVFIPKAKLSGDLALTAQLDTYMLPGATFQGVNEGATNGMLRLRKFDAVTALEIPLRTTTGGFA
jgi:hypothetical protein